MLFSILILSIATMISKNTEYFSKLDNLDIFDFILILCVLTLKYIIYTVERVLSLEINYIKITFNILDSKHRMILVYHRIRIN